MRVSSSIPSQLSFDIWLSQQCCCQCGRDKREIPTSLDHVPSRGILKNPHREDLPTVPICVECNQSFSDTEAYFYAFISSVVEGTHEHDKQSLEKARNVLRSDSRIRKQVKNSRFQTSDDTIVWHPEHSQIWKFLVKNAKGQAFLSTGFINSRDPYEVWYKPILTMDEGDNRYWNESLDETLWAEVGSKKLERQVEEFFTTNNDPWSTVEEGTFRSHVDKKDNVLIVRMVIHEYLAVKCVWVTDF